ncbi:MAG: M23 family metallopeptidase [Christensenellaceae bacterium]|nr:M23 family metallopeptidase [Christensenellaceae bacterium]
MKKLAKILMIILAAMLLFAACAKQESAAEEVIPTPAPTPETTPEPTPEPVVFDETAASEQLEKLIAEGLRINAAVFEDIPDNMFAEENEWNIFGTKQDDREWLPKLPKALDRQIYDSVEPIVRTFMESGSDGAYSAELEWEMQYDTPNWQMIYTLLKGANSAEQANEALAKCFVPAVDMRKDGEAYIPMIGFDVLPYRDAIAQLGMDEAGTMGCSFSYSYCITVYNALAEEQEYVQPEPDGNFLTCITWPLESHTRLRKTWYADRDGGARKHTGTDIWAAADTELYSCTDGTVTFIGYSDGMGNAVIVTDEYGYEFHYYHMIRLTDFLKEGDTVKAGDLIGHVGNTGNSARDHLHLTIVAPDGFYVNPYPYLLAVEP